MVMRIAALCAVLAIATGLSVSHTPDVAKVQSTLGQTLLLEVQQKLDAGFDTGDIEKVIGEIGQRITTAQTADTKQHDQVQTNCTIDKQTYADAVNEALDNIRKTKTAINVAEAAYDALVAQTKTLQGEIQVLSADIEELMDTIEKNRAERAADHDAFVNRSYDTTTVIAAIEQIMGLQIGSSLDESFGTADKEFQANVQGGKDAINDKGAHEEEHRAQTAAHDAEVKSNVTAIDESAKKYNVETDDRYKTIDDYKLEEEGKDGEAQNLESDASRVQLESGSAVRTAFVALTNLAKKTSDPITASFLQTAAAACSAIPSDDMDTLLRLFQELKDELATYTDTLIRNEKQAALDHLAEEFALTDSLRSKQATKQAKQDELQEVYRKKHEMAETIANLREDLDNWVQQREDNRALLQARTQECDIFLKEYQERKQDREDQSKTLQIISDFVTKTIKKTLDANQRVKNEVRKDTSDVQDTQANFEYTKQ